MKNSVNDTIIRKVNSELSQVVMIPRHFEYMLADRTVFLHLTTVELVGAFISLDLGMRLENHFQLLEHLICSVAFTMFLKSRF